MRFEVILTNFINRIDFKPANMMVYVSVFYPAKYSPHNERNCANSE